MTKQIVYYGMMILACALNRVQAQDSSSKKPASYFKIGASYLSDNVYMGRKDSVAIPYLSPEIGFYHSSGLFLKASGSYLRSENRFDAFTFDGGYTFSKKKWDGEFTAEKSFYSNQSYNVRAEVQGSVSAYLGYDLGFIKPALNASAEFGNSTDYAASLELEHTFFFCHDAMDISPSLYINASTQNNYSAYYKKRKYVKTKKGKTIPYDITAFPLNPSRFNILDYEFNASYGYSTGHFSFEFIPTLAIPVHPSQLYMTVKGPNGGTLHRTVTEKIGPTFFWSLGITWKG
jgi:hypothetical protein